MRTLSAIAGIVTLSVATAAMAGPRGPEFPISVAEAKNQAEARFQEHDADGSGDLSPEEFAAAAKLHRFVHGSAHRHMGRGHSADGGRAERGGKRLGRHGAMDGELFERLDEDGDGLLSRNEFDGRKMAEARRGALHERMFARLDRDGSGGVTRDELPDVSRRLEAMDADGDGTVTETEARAHREARREAHQARRAERG